MFKNALNYQNTPINAANRALGTYVNIWKSARRLLQSQIIQVASWPDWQSICTCCYRNGDDRHHSAVQRAEIQLYCRYYISIGYTYTNYHRCAPEIPSSLNSIQTSSILLRLYFEQALWTVKDLFVQLRSEFPRVSFLASFATLHPFPGALCPPWHGAVPGSLQGAPRNISSGAPKSRPQSPRTNHKTEPPMT